MMIVISSDDFRRLSSSCQQEVLSLLSSKEQDVHFHEGEFLHSHPYEDVDMPFIDDGWYESLHSINNEAELAKQADFSFRKSAVAEPGSKEVIEISVEQARDLIANVSEKSQACLRKFASGQVVSLGELIGPQAPYRDLNELKRSLIGAVNRRLRTVTKNRTAVLFSSDRDKTRIRVTPLTGMALRQALGVQEPMPIFDFYDQSGLQVCSDSNSVLTLSTLLETAWKALSVRPIKGQVDLSAAQAMAHFVEHGFSLASGKPVVDEDNLQPLRYEFTTEPSDPKVLLKTMDPHGHIDVSNQGETLRLRVFVKHSSVSEICGALSG